jgi:rhamnogalacturonan endolyase
MFKASSRRARRLRAPAAAVIGLVAATATMITLNAADAATVRYEAESAPATCDGTIDSNHAGYSGSGFCNSNNAVGAANQYTVNAAAAGTATLAIRYAHGGTDTRSSDVIVNGATVQAASAFPATGAWTTWSTKTVTVPVNAGANTIRLTASTAAGLANIDYIELEDGAPPQTGDGRYEVEELTRGVTVVPSSSGRLVSWRLLGTDPSNVAFNVYRDGTKLNANPLTGSRAWTSST